MPWRPFLPARSTTPRGHVYLLHIEPAFGHASHYLGSVRSQQPAAKVVRARLRKHERGQSGVRLLLAALAAGCSFTLVRVWEDVPVSTEYKLKNRGGASRLCPTCRAATAATPSRCALAHRHGTEFSL